MTSRHGTSHVVTADASGMAISLTTTVNLLFGSQLVVPETGVIMNNEMNDFSIPNQSNAFGYAPSPANFIKPGKRPLSSISPTIVEYLENGTLYYVIGSAGGSRIITATIQNLWHVLDQNETVKESLAEPRLHDQVRSRKHSCPSQGSCTANTVSPIAGTKHRPIRVRLQQRNHGVHESPGPQCNLGCSRRVDCARFAQTAKWHVRGGGRAETA